MDIAYPVSDATFSPSASALLERVTGHVGAMRARAAALDSAGQFAALDLAELRMAGCLAAPVPAQFGGLGLGTDPAAAGATLAMLRLIGSGNLAVGRIIEGHVNALRLVMLFGSAGQKSQAAAEARDGHLFALWIAERKPLLLTGPPEKPLLRGRKSFGSAVGAASRAIVTATDAGGESWLVSVATDQPEVVTEALAHLPQGMRAAGNGRIVFHDAPGTVLGSPGDYLREPEFSAGAWRASAVALGGLDALIEAARDQIRTRARDTDPHQLARMGHALIAQETASLWLRKAAHIADSDTGSGDRQAYVNLARLAVESACLDALRLIQRSLGLAAFVPPNPIERLARDLGTFLRQPAPDEALTDGAAYYMRHALPRDDGP